MRVLILGCGYVGLPLGAELARRGHQVHGMRRSGSDEMRALGIEPLIGDVTQPGTLRLATEFDWIVNSVSSSKGGIDEYRAVYLEGNRNVMRAFSATSTSKYIFTSSTSVYGQSDGRIVTEASATEPASATSRILVESEDLLREAHRQGGFPTIIARVSGIYGPGRGFLFQQFLKGEARMTGDGQRYINMIHLDDVVGGMIALLERGRTGEVYNLTDDMPVRQVEFFEWLSKRLGRPMPPVASGVEALQRKRGLTNKRVSNAKLKAELQFAFRYPTFREGYEALIGDGSTQPK